ncbi:MAG: hypothetical protein P8179_01690 [Candidatus Thiodiazotropha sp.]
MAVFVLNKQKNPLMKTNRDALRAITGLTITPTGRLHGSKSDHLLGPMFGLFSLLRHSLDQSKDSVS